MPQEAARTAEAPAGDRGTTCLPHASERAVAVCRTAIWCDRVAVPGDGVDSPVCTGRASAGGEGAGSYYWLCRQCMIVYPGFETQEAARHMAHSHGVLRWREHAVGRAVEAKRRAGLAATLTLEELQAAFRQCTEPASVPSGSGGV